MSERVWRLFFGDSLYHLWPADVRSRIPMGRIRAACELQAYPIRLGTAMSTPRSRVCPDCLHRESGVGTGRDSGALPRDPSVMVRAIMDRGPRTSQHIVDTLGALKLASRSALGHQGPRGA